MARASVASAVNRVVRMEVTVAKNLWRFAGRTLPQGPLGSIRGSLFGFRAQSGAADDGQAARRSLRSSVVLRGNYHRDEYGTRHRRIAGAPATFAALSSLHMLAGLPARQQRD